MAFATAVVRLPALALARCARTQVAGAQGVERALAHVQAFADFVSRDLIGSMQGEKMTHEGGCMTAGNLALFFRT